MPSEQGVWSIKHVLNKIPSFTDKTLRTVIFNVNQHVAPDGSGSPTDSFLKQRIRNGLPTLIEKEVKCEDLMRIRAPKQIGAAKKKGRTSSDVFELNDEVRIQDMNTKRLNKVCKITAKREADDEQNVSYVIELENLCDTIRH